jgi:hypothetical protein
MAELKFALTFVDSQGLRVLAHANDGRRTWKTKKEGETHLTNMLKNNDKETLESIFGENPQFEVREVVCYSNGEVTQAVFED